MPLGRIRVRAAKRAQMKEVASLVADLPPGLAEETCPPRPFPTATPTTRLANGHSSVNQDFLLLACHLPVDLLAKESGDFYK